MRFALFLGVCFLLSSFVSPVNAADDSSNATKEWTVLVFLNGNNNLDSFGTLNLTQMEQVGSTNDMNIVVQWASYAADKTKRLLVKKSTDSTTVTSPVVQELPRVDMGDPAVLQDFINWGVKNYPAKHYFIDVWDHGGGWHLRNGNSAIVRDISYDDYSGHSITTEQLAIVMGATSKLIGHKVDIYGSDACMMGAAEVMQQMADSVNIFVGSEETEPGAGWPYNTWLQRWTATPNLDAKGIAKILSEEYVKSFQTGDQSGDVTMSVVDLNQIGVLDEALRNFAAKAKALPAGDLKKLNDTISGSVSFADDDYVDLGDYVAQAQKSRVRGLLTSDYTSIQTALAAFVVSNNDTAKYANAKGVSIWLPKTKDVFDQYSARYMALKIQGATGWGNFLTAMLSQP